MASVDEAEDLSLSRLQIRGSLPISSKVWAIPTGQNEASSLWYS